jgi:hypothetical protein
MVCWSAQAQDPDDEYLRIFNLIQDADSIAASTNAAPALAKYQQAQKALQSFHNGNPDWNNKVISYRRKYVADKIADLTKKPTEAETQPETKASVSATADRMKLLEPGAEPRTVLRLHPKPGDKQTLEVSLKVSMDTKVGEASAGAIKMPITMAMDVTVKSVSAEGDVAYDIVIGDITLAEDPAVPPQVAQALQAALGGIKGLSGTGTMSSRCQSKGTEIKMPAGAGAQTRQMMEQINQVFENVLLPLPEEAVGAGAKWQINAPFKSQGIAVDQVNTFQLVSVEGDLLKTSVSTTQRAANQKIQNPAMPGVKLDLTKLSGNGTGIINFDLAHLLPQEATSELHSEYAMAMNMGGQKQPMTMKVDVNAQLKSK